MKRNGCDSDSRGKFVSKDPQLSIKGVEKLLRLSGDKSFDIDLYGH